MSSYHPRPSGEEAAASGAARMGKNWSRKRVSCLRELASVTGTICHRGRQGSTNRFLESAAGCRDLRFFQELEIRPPNARQRHRLKRSVLRGRAWYRAQQRLRGRRPRQIEPSPETSRLSRSAWSIWRDRWLCERDEAPLAAEAVPASNDLRTG
jgi:hypothetical protein